MGLGFNFKFSNYTQNKIKIFQLRNILFPISFRESFKLCSRTVVLKHFAFKNPFAFLNIEEYNLDLSKAIKKVIEKN